MRTNLRLVARAMLSPAEAALLTVESDTIRREILRRPPTDFSVACYTMPVFVAAHDSFDRLGKRLGLLQGLAAGGKVSPAVLLKILPTVRRDLARLADPKQAAQVFRSDRDKVEKLTADTRAAVSKIEKLLTAPAVKGK